VLGLRRERVTRDDLRGVGYADMCVCGCKKTFEPRAARVLNTTATNESVFASGKCLSTALCNLRRAVKGPLLPSPRVFHVSLSELGLRNPLINSFVPSCTPTPVLESSEKLTFDLKEVYWIC
jgi:hypothetical protein